jgi:flagellar protein FliO/FliZ
MFQTLAVVLLFIALLGALPFALKWLQRRNGVAGQGQLASSRVVSAVAVGPQQRVVTVEVGPEGAKTWLVLGVTAHSVNHLHTLPSPAAGKAPGVAEPLALD